MPRKTKAELEALKDAREETALEELVRAQLATQVSVEASKSEDDRAPEEPTQEAGPVLGSSEGQDSDEGHDTVAASDGGDELSDEPAGEPVGAEVPNRPREYIDQRSFTQGGLTVWELGG